MPLACRGPRFNMRHGFMLPLLRLFIGAALYGGVAATPSMEASLELQQVCAKFDARSISRSKS